MKQKNPSHSFIDRVIRESGAASATAEKRQLFIFPNRRAGIHFKKHLAGHLRGPSWAPEVMSLSDFIARQSPLQPADRMTLLFELYEVYRSINPEDESGFEAFIPWGQMMLRDFDECDRYLVDARLLFTQIGEVHRLEEDFGPQLSDYEAFKNIGAMVGHGGLVVFDDTADLGLLAHFCQRAPQRGAERICPYMAAALPHLSAV